MQQHYFFLKVGTPVESIDMISILTLSKNSSIKIFNVEIANDTIILSIFSKFKFLFAFKFNINSGVNFIKKCKILVIAKIRKKSDSLGHH